jgi:hypothetical protein
LSIRKFSKVFVAREPEFDRSKQFTIISIVTIDRLSILIQYNVMKRNVNADPDDDVIWWEKALIELEYARRNLEMEIFSVAVFLCHQSLEKGFKSMIITKYGEYPKMHSLKDLAMFLDAPLDIIAKCRSTQSTRNPDILLGSIDMKRKRSLKSC